MILQKKLGFVGLTYYDSGQRSFYMSKGPVTSPDDLKGKKNSGHAK